MRRQQVLLDAKATVCANDDEKKSPLHRAAECGNVAAVEILLRAKTRVSHDLRHALITVAIKEGQSSVLQLLLDTAPLTREEASSLLQSATLTGHSAVMEVLLNAKASFDVGDDDNETRLLIASASGDTGAIRALLAAKTNVNVGMTTRRMTPLEHAARNGHSAAVQVLIDARADVCATNHSDYTALSYAVSNGDAASVRLLVDARADVNASSPVHCPLVMSAVRSGQNGVVRALIEAKADPCLHATLRFVLDIKGVYVGPAARLDREDGAIAKTLVDAKASLDKGGDPRTTRLFTAAMCGEAAEIQSLLQDKASVDARESIFEATPLYSRLDMATAQRWTCLSTTKLWSTPRMPTEELLWPTPSMEAM